VEKKEGEGEKGGQGGRRIEKQMKVVWQIQSHQE
jgi:hypothetical protein